MATLNQLGIALKNADAAGDTAAATKLVGAIKQARGMPSDVAPAPLDTGDIAKSAGTGLVRGAEGALGTPADLATSNVPSKIGQTLFDPVFHFFEGLAGQTPAQSAARDTQSAKTQEAILGGASKVLPTSQNIAKVWEPEITGGQGLHEPTTTPGKFAETAGEFAAGAAAGPVKGILGRVAKFGLLPGVASEAAGQATAGSPLEGPARFAAGLAAGGLGALEKNPETQFGAKVQELTTAKDNFYKAADLNNVILNPTSTQMGLGSAIHALEAQRFKPAFVPETSAIVKQIRDDVRANPALAVSEVEQYRSKINDALRKPTAAEAGPLGQGTTLGTDDKRALVILKQGIDKFMDDMWKNGSMFVMHGATPQEIRGFVEQGRALHMQLKKADAVDKIFTAAENNAVANTSLLGKQSSLMREWKNFVNSPKFRALPWSAEEKKMLTSVLHGGPLEKFLGAIASIHGIGDKTSLGTLLKVVTSPVRAAAHIGGKVRGGVARDKLAGARTRTLNPGAVAGQVTGNRAADAPVQGAQKAADGQWYVPDTNRSGKYLQVSP